MRAPGTFRRKVLSSVLVKPAGAECDLACAYCFYRDKAGPAGRGGPSRMTDEVLGETVRQTLAYGGPLVEFGWQGGEPTLAGLDFFRRAVALQERHRGDRAVTNALQTNGLRIDAEWTDFLRRRRFLVGLSIDGPEAVHDRYRRTRDGRGTWALVVDRARRLLDAGVEVNAMAVVHDRSALCPDETYSFFKELGLVHMQFLPCVETDPADPSRAAAFSAPAEAYGLFLRRLFDLWLADFRDGAPTTSIRLFESLFYSYVGRRPPDCALRPECGDYLVVERDGDVYPCDFFVEERLRLGNVRADRLDRLLNSARQAAFGRAKAILPGPCRSCRRLAFCRGGCPKDRLRDPRDGGLDHFCAGTRLFLEHADHRLRELAEAWKARHPGASA